MSQNNHSRSSGGRGRSNRGGPRRDRDRDEPRRSSAPAAPAKKPSLWEKIVSIFSGSKPAAKNGAARTYAPYTPRDAGGSKAGESNERPPREPARSRDSNPAQDRSSSRDDSYAPTPRPARKPEAIEVTTEKLYVGNLSFDAGESDLSELFNGVGAVRSAEIVTHKHNEKSKGFGFVTMATIDEAKRAVEVLHDKDFMGRKLVVSGAKTPIERE